MGVGFFFMFSASTIAGFVARGHSLPEDYKALLYPMIVSVVGGIVAGLVFHAILGNYRGPK
jgi:succinate dehydrogenase/fumarate reductase cytochrome b subunit